ncbi:hypothetical protein BDW02DRAFT_574743, partial [Decorospora gaudefroyi]
MTSNYTHSHVPRQYVETIYSPTSPNQTFPQKRDQDKIEFWFWGLYLIGPMARRLLLTTRSWEFNYNLLM